MNIKDIARLSGVSVATVSRVINNQPSVSQKSRERVLAVMAENNFTPNIFARGLNSKSTKTIGILCPEMNDINHAKIVSILEHLLRSNGFDSLLCCTGGYRPYNRKIFDLLAAKQVDAILTIGSSYENESDLETYTFIAKHIPIIVINGYVNAPGVYNISCDEKNAIYNLVLDLYKTGCRSIYFLEDNITYSACQKREGFLKGIRECGLSEESSCIQVPLDTHELMSAKHQIEHLLEKRYPIDAILSADDILAVGALQALNAVGLSIPVIGFNNSDYAICCTPYLTSIDNRIDFMCTTAINTLMSLLNGEEALERIVLSAKLVERETYIRNSK
jgi:LacI family transcriptional regulator